MQVKRIADERAKSITECSKNFQHYIVPLKEEEYCL